MPKLVESSRAPLVVENAKVLSGPFASLGVFNENGRTYPDDVYIPALEALLPKIREGRLLGELDHPLEYDELRLSNVSHVITECSVRESASGTKEVYGKVKLLDTPAGRIAQALVEAGVPLGISSRGVGNTRSVREGSEVTDLKLITYDLVAEPSFSNAILMTESKKSKLCSRLDSVESSLPLCESKDSSGDTIREYIRQIRESLENVKDPTEELVEAVGLATMESQEMKSKLKESATRCKSLQENLHKLQESYNKASESNKSLKKQIKEMEELHNKAVSDIENMYESQVITLRKQLAIEKRGMSPSTTMPLLEGLKTEGEINAKLDSLKSLKSRGNTGQVDIATLTEGLTQVAPRPSRLAKVVSSV